MKLNQYQLNLKLCLMLVLVLALLTKNTTAQILTKTFILSNGYSLDSTAINLSQKTIKSIDLNALSLFTKLKVIDLSDNKIKNIPSTLFSGLKELRSINLSLNKIKTLSSTQFNGLKKLVSLDLSKNPIKSLNSNLFSNLSNLTELRLDGCELESLVGSTFDSLVNLDRLYLSNNEIETLDKSLFKMLKNLTFLSLDGNKLSSIESISELTSINYLSLLNNENVRINSEIFQKLGKLEKVCLDQNINLGKEDCTVCDFDCSKNISTTSTTPTTSTTSTTSTTTTSTTSTSSTTIINNISFDWTQNGDLLTMKTNLVYLQEAYGIIALPLNTSDTINELVSAVTNGTLNSFFAPSGASLESVNIANIIASLPKVQRITLSFPPIQYDLNKQILYSYNYTIESKMVECVNKKISFVDPNTFAELINLEYLSLKENKIISIDFSVFSSLSDLKVLNLASNNFTVIKSTMFDGLSSLETLLLQNNKIKLLELGWSKSLTSLLRIYLNDNLYLNNLTNDVFNGATKLRLINLENSSFKFQDEKNTPFSMLSNLKDLYLSKNNLLGSIFSNSFANLTDLRNLGLQFTNIDSLDVQALEKSLCANPYNVVKVNIYGNNVTTNFSNTTCLKFILSTN